MVQKTVNIKAKTGLKFSIIVRNLNIYCFRGHCFLNNTIIKVQTQETIIKNLCFKERKAKNIKPAYVKTVEFGEQGKKDKKKRRLKSIDKTTPKSGKKPRPLATTPSISLRKT